MIKNIFKVGDVIYGFCNGFFGRDDYENKVCVFVTETYAVFQYLANPTEATILNYSQLEHIKSDISVIIKEWKTEKVEW